MTRFRLPHPALTGAAAATALALVAAGCGASSSASHSSTAAASTAVASASSTSTTKAAKPSRPLRLHIISPRAGAHTGESLTVRVAVTGTASGRVHSFRYVLDGALTRHGNARLTFHGLAPGRQHLLVSVAGDPGLHAAAVFVVRTPPVPVAPVPAATSSAPTSTTPAPAPTTPAPTTSAPTTAAPAPQTTTSAPAPTTSAPASGIPQGGGGDMDGDNSGGPSDGDGGV